MTETTCIITGGNAGIGYETARRLAMTGARVVLVCRNAERGEAAIDRLADESGNRELSLQVCDLGSQAAVRRAAEELGGRFKRLDVLINNAALYSPVRRLTADGIEMQFAANYLGHFLLTNLLLDTLKASAPSRIVNLTTINHFQVSLPLDDLQAERSFEPKVVHMRSKLALILFTYELARRLAGTGVTANCVHPGVIATNLLGDVRNVAPQDRITPAMGGRPPEEGGQAPFYLATAAELADVSGKYFDRCREAPSSDETRDREKARRLWAMSAKLTGLPDDSAQSVKQLAGDA